MLFRAQATLYWPGISVYNENKKMICHDCHRIAPSQAKLLPQSPQIPTVPFFSYLETTSSWMVNSSWWLGTVCQDGLKLYQWNLPLAPLDQRDYVMPCEFFKHLVSQMKYPPMGAETRVHIKRSSSFLPQIGSIT